MVERINNTVRARERPARGLKSPEGPLSKGQAPYYNLIRPHSALNGRTPSEAAGLPTAKDGNRWLKTIRAGIMATGEDQPEHTTTEEPT